MLNPVLSCICQYCYCHFRCFPRFHCKRWITYRSIYDPFWRKIVYSGSWGLFSGVIVSTLISPVRFKHNFSIHTIKAGSSAYAETQTLLWLIIWTIAERQSFQAECFLAQKRECSYSVYEKCKISFIQVTDILRLSWSFFADLTDKKYTHYLSKKQRWRINQNDECHSVVLPGLLS